MGLLITQTVIPSGIGNRCLADRYGRFDGFRHGRRFQTVEHVLDMLCAGHAGFQHQLDRHQHVLQARFWHLRQDPGHHTISAFASEQERAQSL